MLWKKVVYIVSAFLLSSCAFTRHTPGEFNDVCIGVPYTFIYCVLIWLGVTAFLGLVLNNFSANLWASLFPMDEDWDANVAAWKGTAFVGGILALGAIACFFIFMYPDAQAIASGVNTCSSVITPLGGGQ
jgi:hypothetical protein